MPPVFFMYSHYVPLIFFSSKNAKNKVIRKHRLPSHSSNNLKPRKPCGQSSIKTFYKGLPQKKGKLNLITSTVANKYVVVRSFGSSSIIGCSEKASIITKIFESYSELVPSSLEIKVLKKKFLSIRKKSRQTYSGRCGNYNISYSKKIC